MVQTQWISASFTEGQTTLYAGLVVKHLCGLPEPGEAPAPGAVDGRDGCSELVQLPSCPSLLCCAAQINSGPAALALVIH